MTPSWPALKKGTHSARALWNDTSGVILPYVTVMLVVIVGLSVLALDGARLMSLQTQLQNGADALALAGAAELDRLPDAETRARTAIQRLLTNSTLFGSPGQQDHRGLEHQVLRPSAGERCEPNVGGNARDKSRQCALCLGLGATCYPPDNPSSSVLRRGEHGHHRRFGGRRL